MADFFTLELRDDDAAFILILCVLSRKWSNKGMFRATLFSLTRTDEIFFFLYVFLKMIVPTCDVQETTF